MGSCLIAKFKHYMDLTESEEKLLARLEERQETYGKGDVIRKKGDPVEDLFTVNSGWTYTYTQTDDDNRSIFDVRVDGDFIGLSELSFDKSLYTIVALDAVTVCPFPKKTLNEVFGESEKLSRAFYSIISREQAILYERIFSLSRRTALEKVAHFLLEISMRTGLIGKKLDETFTFPLTQQQMGELLGLSKIHINKSLNELRRHKYIDYNRSKMKILDTERMMSLGNFEPDFLQYPNIDWHIS